MDYDYKSDAWLEKVSHTTDTPLRTHRITLTYNRLATEVNNLIFGPWLGRNGQTSNANWFNFATWGTYSLGPNIRNDSAPQRLDSLTSTVRRRVAPAIVHSRAADGDLVGRALAWGEYLIFCSVTPAAIKFLRTKPVKRWDTPPDFNVSLPGEALGGASPDLAVEGVWFDDSHGLLVDEAFRYYFLARQYLAQLPDQGQDAGANPIVCRLLLLGTILLTAVEQDIVNTAISTVVGAVPVRVLRQVDGRLARIIAARRRLPREVVALNLYQQTAKLQSLITDGFARLMTRELLVLVLPRETLRVGRDIPPLDCSQPLYPTVLDNLISPPDDEMNALKDAFRRLRRQPFNPVPAVNDALQRLSTVVESMDRTSQDGVGSAARDWRNFDDRLNWAICLFRSRQQDPTLYWPVYSEEDEDRIQRGKLPRGRAVGPVAPPLSKTSADAITAFLAAEKGQGGGADD